jgi:hypothetical protein
MIVFPSLLRSPSGRHRGGRVTVERLVKFIACEYHQTDRITTLVDYYGFQNRLQRSKEELEADIRKGIAIATTGYDERFVLPYVQMYEFEGILFSDPNAFEWVEDGWNEQTCLALTQVRQAFSSPEEINDSTETAPSKRILSIFEKGSYSKTEHGPLIAEAIGVDTIREQCPRFDAWVSQIQEWAE